LIPRGGPKPSPEEGTIGQTVRRGEYGPGLARVTRGIVGLRRIGRGRCCGAGVRGGGGPGFSPRQAWSRFGRAADLPTQPERGRSRDQDEKDHEPKRKECPFSVDVERSVTGRAAIAGRRRFRAAGRALLWTARVSGGEEGSKSRSKQTRPPALPQGHWAQDLLDAPTPRSNQPSQHPVTRITPEGCGQTPSPCQCP
jgi:hypothetical protein